MESAQFKITQITNEDTQVISCRIFISGKISGLELREAMLNFEKAQMILENSGYEVINPFEIKGWKVGLLWNDYMNLCIPELLKCQAIYMLSNCGQSRGSRIERAIALELGLKVIYE